MSSAAKFFLKLNGSKGPIAGDARAKGYLGHIDIDDFSWSMQREKPPNAAGENDMLTVPSVISFSKLVDTATTPMLTAMKTGDLLTAMLTLEETSAAQFKLQIKLVEARLLDYSIEIKGDDKSGTAEESWTIDYRTITLIRTVEGTSSEYSFERPAWASNDAPKGGADQVEADFRKLLKDLEPGRLDSLWRDIKKELDTVKLKPRTTKGDDEDEDKK